MQGPWLFPRQRHHARAWRVGKAQRGEGEGKGRKEVRGEGEGGEMRRPTTAQQQDVDWMAGRGKRGGGRGGGEQQATEFVTPQLRSCIRAGGGGVGVGEEIGIRERGTNKRMWKGE